VAALFRDEVAAFNRRDRPLSAVFCTRRCGTIPAVHPTDAKTLARRPRRNPVATVYTTPVPGMKTTINEVTRKFHVITVTIPVRRWLDVNILAKKPCHLPRGKVVEIWIKEVLAAA